MTNNNTELLGVEIGCGHDKREGMIGLDLRRTPVTDIVADARVLPFKSEIFHHVSSSHCIEHISHKDVVGVLGEWVRVLRKGGTIEIRCPDLRARAFLFFLSPSWQNVENIYGGQSYPYEQHRCGFSFGLLRLCLESNGITNVKRVIKGYRGIPFLPDCLHIRGTKR